MSKLDSIPTLGDGNDSHGHIEYYGHRTYEYNIEVCLNFYVFLFLHIYIYTRKKQFSLNAGWWFGTFFIFPYIGNNHPNWLVFFRGVQTTNQNVIFQRINIDGEPTMNVDHFPNGNHGFFPMNLDHVPRNTKENHRFSMVFLGKPMEFPRKTHGFSTCFSWFTPGYLPRWGRALFRVASCSLGQLDVWCGQIRQGTEQLHLWPRREPRGPWWKPRCGPEGFWERCVFCCFFCLAARIYLGSVPRMIVLGRFFVERLKGRIWTMDCLDCWKKGWMSTQALEFLAGCWDGKWKYWTWEKNKPPRRWVAQETTMMNSMIKLVNWWAEWLTTTAIAARISQGSFVAEGAPVWFAPLDFVLEAVTSLLRTSWKNWTIQESSSSTNAQRSFTSSTMVPRLR